MKFLQLKKISVYAWASFYNVYYFPGEYHCDYETSCETKDQCTTVESRMKGGDCYQPYGKQTKHCCLLALTSAQPPGEHCGALLHGHFV